MRAFALILLCALGARAEGIRVEPRLFVKRGHFFASVGGAWLDRRD